MKFESHANLREKKDVEKLSGSKNQIHITLYKDILH